MKMPSRKKFLALLLATLQLACSFSFGAYEAAAQIVRAPAGRTQAGGVPLIPVSVVGAFASFSQTPGLPQASFAPALAPGFLPAPAPIIAAATIAPAPATAVAIARAVAAPALLPATAANPGARRDAPSEDSSRAGAESFAKLYPEKLIDGERAALDAVAAPEATRSLFTHGIPLSAASKTERPNGVENSPPAATKPAPAGSVWKTPAVRVALGLAAAAALAVAAPLLSAHTPIVAAVGSVALSVIGIPQIVKNYRSGGESVKDLAIAGPLIWFAAAVLLSVVSIGSGSSFWWNAANLAGAVESAVILGQINFHKRDRKELMATALTAAAVLALVPLIASQILLPLTAGLAVSFAAAMALLAVLNWPQIRRNHAIFRTEGRAPIGIAPLYPALVVGGSLLHLYAAVLGGDVRWAVNSAFGILTTSLVLAQIYAPRAAHAFLGPVVRLIERLLPAMAVLPGAAARPMRILITGPPGAGKTTYGKMLARDFGMIHVSVGELLRERAASDPALSAAMAKGELVDSALVRGLVLERLARPDVLAHGFILDGFPRRAEEIGVIESWQAAGGKLDALVHLTAPDAELLRRIQARGRMDDSPEVFRRRMEIYREQTQPVLDHFRRGVRVLEADAGGPDIESTYAGVRALVERVRAEP